jgi:hypothetical protein
VHVSPLAQASPQPPQLLSSVCVSEQTPVQQVSPPAQALPQAPQWLVFELVSLQLPEQQIWDAVQRVPQLPQLFASVLVVTQTPEQQVPAHPGQLVSAASPVPQPTPLVTQISSAAVVTTPVDAEIAVV